MSHSVKICGVRDADAAEVAADAGADRLGVVFVPTSPRATPIAAAAGVISEIRIVAGSARIVGLFVDPDDPLLSAAIASGVDEIQLHGRETPVRCAEIRERYARPVWKALGVADASDVRASAAYTGAIDGLYFDALPPEDAENPGGNGLRFDPIILQGFDGFAPFMLAGGLDPENVAEAISETRGVPGFSGVDVSSGVESAPGVKDPALIRAFVTAARTAYGEE